MISGLAERVGQRFAKIPVDNQVGRLIFRNSETAHEFQATLAAAWDSQLDLLSS